MQNQTRTRMPHFPKTFLTPRMQRPLRLITTLVVVLALLTFNLPVRTVRAAAVTSFDVTLSRVRTSTLANQTIEFVTPTGVNASTDTITLTFAAAFTMGTFAVANVDFAQDDDGGCNGVWTDKTLAASAAAGTWGVAQAGQVITLTAPTDAGATEIPASRCVQIEIGSNATAGAAGTTQITNPSTAASHTVTIGGAFGDTGSAAVGILTDEQVSVTATVDPSITFTVDDTTVGFGTIVTSAGRWATGDALGAAASATTPTAAHTMTVATNAQSGYVVTYNGATLTSGANTITDAAFIDEDSDGTPGTEQFGIDASTSGNATIAANYLRDAVADWDFVPSTTTTLVSETVATATETISVSYLANIAATTEAGSYSTTLTYIATGMF